MRRYAFAFLTVLTAILAVGCSGDGMAYSGREYREISRRAWDVDQKQLIDDLHYLNLDEQSSRMSLWTVTD